MCFYFYYLLMILINRFGWNKREMSHFARLNILLYIYLLFFLVTLLIIVNKFFLFISIDDY
jgi:hypothetical protein